MNLKSIAKGILGIVLTLVGLVILYITFTAVGVTDCKSVFTNGKLTHHSCSKVYYTIASHRVAGEIIGDVLIAFGALFIIIGVWVLWRTLRTTSEDETPSLSN